MALILTGFRQNNKTQAIPTSVAKIINARQGSGPSWGFASREHDIYFHLPFYFHSASWPRIGRPRKSPGWTFSFGSSAWDVEPQWIGPSWGFASREHGISFHSDLYSPSGSWPRIVALPAAPPFFTEGLGY